MSCTKTFFHSARVVLIILLTGCLANLEAGVAQTQERKANLPSITRPADTDTLLLLHFDEPAGTTLFQDSSPYKHHAMCHSAVCPTKAQRGLDFNGQGRYIMSSASIQGLSSFTLAGWFYARSYEHAGKHPIVFTAPGVDCGRAALRIGGGYTEGPVLFVADTDNCAPQMVVSVSGVPALNQWHHIVAVFDSDTDQHAIYINGQKVAENVYPIGPIPDTTPGHPMNIGVNYSPRPYDQRWWDGYIDEVALYSRALSASEVEALYRGSMIQVTKHASDDVVHAGSSLTYTLRVTNTSSVDLHAIITDTLPAHVTPTGILTWTGAITAPGGVWAQQIAVTVDMGYTGALTNTVQVTTEEGAIGTSSIAVNVIGYSVYLPLVLGVQLGACRRGSLAPCGR